MKISIQVTVDNEDGSPVVFKNIAELNKKSLSKDTLGLTLEESKLLLNNVQSEIVQQQVSLYIYKNNNCAKCNQTLKVKENTEIVYRTLFGKLRLQNPRLYRCSCNRPMAKELAL